MTGVILEQSQSLDASALWQSQVCMLVPFGQCHNKGIYLRQEQASLC